MTDNLATALAAFQQSLPRIGKSETAVIPPKDGKAGFRYTYADLADVNHTILPLLAKHGLTWACCPTVDDGKFVLAYSLIHGATWEKLTGSWPLGSGTPQQMGSAVTYARRYCLTAVTGVVPDADDDGAAASTSRPQTDHYAPSAPPTETDVDWQNSWMQRVSEAETQGVLRGLWGELVEAAKTSLTPDDAQHMKVYLEARKADLEQAGAGAVTV